MNWRGKEREDEASETGSTFAISCCRKWMAKDIPWLAATLLLIVSHKKMMKLTVNAF